MKKLSVILASMALVLAAYLWVELARARELLRQQEAKTATLGRIQAQLAASQAKK